MSRAAEFRRLLLHASERLSQEEKTVVAKFVATADAGARDPNVYGRCSTVIATMKDLASYTAAVTYAQLVMETVASFLVDDDPTPADTTQETKP